MAEIIKYKLTLPVTQIRVTADTLTFSIGQVRSRTPSVIYFKFYAYYYYGDMAIIEYTSPRWVITSNYSLQYDTFNIKEMLDDVPQEVLEELQVTKLEPKDIDHYYIEIYTLGIDSENPLYMNHLMLAEEDKTEYHQPNDAKNDVAIGFEKTYSLNLYDTSDTYLQIIRPYQEDLSSTTIKPSKVTILAPHLPNESTWDNPMNIFYEFMYQTEQRIGIEK